MAMVTTTVTAQTKGRENTVAAVLHSSLSKDEPRHLDREVYGKR